jgi:hypothetical protein
MLLLVAAAWAAFPEDVSITQMDEFNGASTYLPDTTQAGSDYVVTGYQELVKELGVSIANKPMAPGESLGINGFYVGVANTFAFVRTGTTDGVHPTGWDLASEEEDPQTYLFIPWIQVRKGLPASLEVGANAGWIGRTSTGVLGVYGRWSVVEGYRRIPDVALQVGYAGYIGNDELELGVLDMSATVGYSLPFGVTQGINQAVFSPYVSVGVNQIHAAPRADLSKTDLEGRVTEVSSVKTDLDTYVAGFAPFQIGGGFRLTNGDFSTTIAATYSPDLIATVNVGFGFVY